MSNVTVASFRWLEILEKEYDNAFVDMDRIFNTIMADYDSGELIDDNVAPLIDIARHKMKLICKCWTQLVHKAQTIFQVNCKLEVSSNKII
jgi:golgi-associated PDZ and coiled-coil motif-containing protein